MGNKLKLYVTQIETTNGSSLCPFILSVFITKPDMARGLRQSNRKTFTFTSYKLVKL
jgi:hypothetical protein